MINYEGVTKFAQIFNSEFYIFACVAALINTLFACVIARKFMQIMQSGGYLGTPYRKWTYRRDNIYITRLSMMVMLSVMAYLLFSVVFSYTKRQWNSYFGFVFYALFAVIYIHFDFKRKNKALLVMTARAVRLIVTFVILYYLLSLAVLIAVQIIGYFAIENYYFLDVRFGVLCVTPLLIPMVTELANFINKPFENANNRKYIKRTEKTLLEADNLVKIGLTGSYGKTSVKEILKTILSVRFSVLATPASYNTPMGISKSVKRYDGTQDVFIAEMGARRTGEIKELVDIVKPDYGIITGVGNQHLETFGSVDAVMKTKYELCSGVKAGGTVVFYIDNENTYRLSLRAEKENRVKVIKAGIDKSKNPDVYAEDISTSVQGTTFTLCFGEEKISVGTVLIGKHNVGNILVAAALAKENGLTAGEIAEGISLIKPIRHRLEVLKNQKGVTIIDDSYNSNVDGTIAALDVFSGFPGRKIIVTPGLVELGKMQDLENFRFGRRIAEVASFVIIIGGANAYKIRDGLLDADFPYSKIRIFSTLDEGVKYLTEITENGDVVLFENDLPDKFN